MSLSNGKKWQEYQPPLLETSAHLKKCFSGFQRPVLFPFSRTIHNKFGATEGKPVASSSDDLIGGVAPVGYLIVKIFHPINT